MSASTIDSYRNQLILAQNKTELTNEAYKVSNLHGGVDFSTQTTGQSGTRHTDCELDQGECRMSSR